MSSPSPNPLVPKSPNQVTILGLVPNRLLTLKSSWPPHGLWLHSIDSGSPSTTLAPLPPNLLIQHHFWTFDLWSSTSMTDTWDSYLSPSQSPSPPSWSPPLSQCTGGEIDSIWLEVEVGQTLAQTSRLFSFFNEVVIENAGSSGTSSTLYLGQV